jgi:hypothetical protein
MYNLKSCEGLDKRAEEEEISRISIGFLSCIVGYLTMPFRYKRNTEEDHIEGRQQGKS